MLGGILMKKEIQLLLEKFKGKQKNSKIRKNIAIVLSCIDTRWLNTLKIQEKQRTCYQYHCK